MVYVPGCTAYLHPDRNPLNPNGYTATRNTPFVCNVRPVPQPQIQPPPVPQPQIQPPPVPQPQIQPPPVPQPQIQPPPVPQPQIQPPPVPQPQIQALSHAQLGRIESITSQYSTVAELVQDGFTLPQALRQVNLTEKMFQRRRTVAETYLPLPETVTKALRKGGCGSDLESIFQRCKAIAATPKGKLRIRHMSLHGNLLPLDV